MHREELRLWNGSYCVNGCQLWTTVFLFLRSGMRVGEREILGAINSVDTGKKHKEVIGNVNKINWYSVFCSAPGRGRKLSLVILMTQ